MDEQKYLFSPMVAVGAVVIKDQSVLLVKRNKESQKGRWAIPGGSVKLGETLQKAAEREIKEEKEHLRLKQKAQSTGTESHKGSWYLLDNVRMFDEIKSLQDKWISIDDELADIDPLDSEFDWEKMNERGTKLVEEAKKLFEHFAECCRCNKPPN